MKTIIYDFNDMIAQALETAAKKIREPAVKESLTTAMSRERAANVLERRIPEFEGLLHFRIGEYEQIARDTITAIHVAIRALREGV